MGSGRCPGLTGTGAVYSTPLPSWSRCLRTLFHGLYYPGASEADAERTGTGLVRRQGTPVESTGRLSSVGSSQASPRTTARIVASTLLAGSGLVRAIATDPQSHRHPGPGPFPLPRFFRPTSVARRNLNDRIRDEWSSGIRRSVLGIAGYSTNTGGAEEAARLLAEMGWAETTWSTRASQVATWLRFCDEDMRQKLPAEEGDVLAYIGYLSLGRSISPESLPQYVSAVSRYHELHHLPSPTRTPLVRALVRAYHRSHDSATLPVDILVGCPATVMRNIISVGLVTSDKRDFECCVISILALIFQVLTVSLVHFQRGHLLIDVNGLRATIYRRKGKSVRRPLILRYDYNPSWEASGNPVVLISRWVERHPNPTDGFEMTLGDALGRALLLAGASAPE